MIYPHVIRLAGPWEYEVLRADAGAPPSSTSGRMQLPTAWQALLGGDFRGLIRLRRRFNRPTNLDPQETVWVVIEGSHLRCVAGLNGQSLGDLHDDAALGEFEVTSELPMHNELTIDLEHAGSITGVRLEIRRRISVDGAV